jgi:hypothetical protein
MRAPGAHLGKVGRERLDRPIHLLLGGFPDVADHGFS